MKPSASTAMPAASSPRPRSTGLRPRATSAASNVRRLPSEKAASMPWVAGTQLVTRVLNIVSMPSRLNLRSR